ncbi:hypothetical protein PFISCL1PPCAC_24087, partial [Pristionchus fissidentatus]
TPFSNSILMMEMSGGDCAQREIESLRKLNRVSTLLSSHPSIVEPYALNFAPRFTATQDLTLINDRFEMEEFKERDRFRYKTRVMVTASDWDREKKEKERRDRNNRGRMDRTHNERPPPTEKLVFKEVNGVDVALNGLKDGGYELTVKSTTFDLKRRELINMERYLVEAAARMEMSGVKRQKEADSLREVLQEWIADAKIIAEWNDKSSLYSIVSELDKETMEVDENTEMLSLSFSTRFNAVEYSITVQMPNEKDVRVKSNPHLRGVNQVIESLFPTHSLLDVITHGIWKLAAVVE